MIPVGYMAKRVVSFGSDLARCFTATLSSQGRQMERPVNDTKTMAIATPKEPLKNVMPGLTRGDVFQRLLRHSNAA